MTSVVDTSVKFYHSGMVGAPSLQGSVLGSMVAVLDACLKDGWGVRSATSLVVDDGIATLTFTGGNHPAQKDCVILVSGSSITALNGEQKVLNATPTTITFATAEADATASGSISFKLAGAGFVHEFTGTNKAAYKSGKPGTTGFILRVDDNVAGQSHARVIAYESMTDIDTGTSPFPTNAQHGGGGYWFRSSAFNTNSVPWYIFSDGEFFFFCRILYQPGTAFPNHRIDGFGDFISSKPTDAQNCMLGHNSANYDDAFGCFSAASLFYTQNWMFSARDRSALGGSTQIHHMIPGVFSGIYSGGQDQKMVFPNPTNYGLALGSLQFCDGSNSAGSVIDRGTVPGIYHCMQHLRGTIRTGNRIAGSGQLGGRTLMSIKIGALTQDNDVTSGGAVFFDITGPWR